MKYTPVLPEENVNVSHSEPLKEFAEIAVSLTLLALFIFWMLGVVVDRVVDGISAKTEASISRMVSVGPETAPALRPRQLLLQQRVDQLRACSKLARATPVTLHEHDAVNAAVGPGGNMTVFTGLLESALSENGLAFVLAHELAHIEQRDHLRGMGRAITTVAVMAIITGGSGEIDAIIGPGMHLGTAKYSRTREASADLRALEILQCRHGHVGGATELFEQVNKDESDWTVSHYLASHPAMQERIAAVRQHAAANKFPTRATTPLPAALSGR